MTAAFQYNEKDILTKVAKGDEKAFSRLFHYWFPFLSNHIFRITESKELTEEIVQDVFLKIWMAREVLETINSFKAYLLVISKNHALNSLRKISREKKHLDSWKKESDPYQTEEEKSNTPDYITLIDEAIANLPERQKQVFLLHRFEGHTYHQISDKLTIGRETVKTHLKLAKGFISNFVRSKLPFVLLFLGILKK